MSDCPGWCSRHYEGVHLSDEHTHTLNLEGTQAEGVRVFLSVPAGLPQWPMIHVDRIYFAPRDAAVYASMFARLGAAELAATVTRLAELAGMTEPAGVPV